MHDYYRIADVWSGPHRTGPLTERTPWWRTLPGTSGHTAPVTRGGRVRVLEPDATMPALWRDDVALDFPSAQGPAERMRRAFLAEDDPPTRCRLDVEVSGRRALRVSRVPVQLVVPSLCDRCGGRGEAWGDPCATCDGAGVEDESRYVLLRLPAGVRDGTRLCYRLEVPHTSPLLLDVRVNVR